MNNSPTKNPLSTKGYKGTRDFFPADQRLKKHIYGKVAHVLESFGYEEYAGPFVENLELYASKSSEEIVKEQLYSFEDKGGRLVAIRPEMTPTLARMVASRQKELPKPIRWFSIPTCMRYERPQRGRLREFDQLNVDVFGGNPLDEDIEVLLTVGEIFKALGAQTTDFTIHVNHRGLINSFLKEFIKISQKEIPEVLRLFDKKDKLTKQELLNESQKIPLSPEQFELISSFLESQPENLLQWFPSGSPAAALATQLLELISQVNLCLGGFCTKLNLSIMRGFDYYTGMVFEVFDTHPDNRRALCGGGRYDDLVSAFGGETLSGIGYGMGDVALINFIETHNLVPSTKKRTEISVLRFQESDRADTLNLTKILRESGFFVEAPVLQSKFGKQIQSAEKAGIPIVAFRGEEDKESNSFSVKWLSTGEQEKFQLDISGITIFKDKYEKILNLEKIHD